MSASNILEESESKEEQLVSGNDESVSTKPSDNGKQFKLNFYVPPKFHGRIIGAQGSNIRSLKQETNTQILVPRIGRPDTGITIIGTKKYVLSAKYRIDQIVWPDPDSNHFLTIPLTSEEIKLSFLKFKEEVLKSSKTPNDLEPLFQKPEKMHLTIVFLSLSNAQDVENAVKCLEDCKNMIVDKFLQDGPLQVTITGLSFDGSDPSASKKLFANIQSDKLQEIANEVAKLFQIRGFSQRKMDNVLLEITLMNTKWGNESKGKRNRNIKPKWTFNATDILENFELKNFNFGSCAVNEIHMSELGAKAPNGYFQSAGVVTF